MCELYLIFARAKKGTTFVLLCAGAAFRPVFVFRIGNAFDTERPKPGVEDAHRSSGNTIRQLSGRIICQVTLRNAWFRHYI
jgi:hypothetical protein